MRFSYTEQGRATVARTRNLIHTPRGRTPFVAVLVAALFASIAGCDIEQSANESGVVVLSAQPIYEFDMTGDDRFQVVARRSAEVEFRWPDGRSTFSPIPERRMRVSAMALTRNGDTLLTGHIDGSVILWRRGASEFTPTLLRTCDNQVTCVELTPDEGTAVVGTEHGAIWRFDLSTGESSLIARHPGTVRCLAIAGYGRTVVACGVDVRVWSIATGECLLVHRPLNCEVMAVAWSADAKRFAFGTYDGRIAVYRSRDGVPVGSPLAATAHRPYSPVNRLVFAHGGRHLFTVLASLGTVTVRETDTLHRVDRVNLHDASHISQLRLADDGVLFASSHNGTIRSVRLELTPPTSGSPPAIVSTGTESRPKPEADGGE